VTGAIAANQPVCALITPALCVQDGQYDQIAERIAAAVKLNCGQKAVLLAHSMSGNVMLHMLRLPRFKQWRCGAQLNHCQTASRQGFATFAASACLWCATGQQHWQDPYCKDAGTLMHRLKLLLHSIH
jgi:hypothetical protein